MSELLVEAMRGHVEAAKRTGHTHLRIPVADMEELLPRTITTAEELDALHTDSVVRDDEMLWLRGNREWYTPMTTAGYASVHINLPATVLWEPNREGGANE